MPFLHVIATSHPHPTSPRSLYTKEQEFRAWLVEERKINPETITHQQTKKEFARFVEDYNTGSSSRLLPCPINLHLHVHDL